MSDFKRLTKQLKLEFGNERHLKTIKKLETLRELESKLASYKSFEKRNEAMGEIKRLQELIIRLLF